jgi:hypothetical protein
MTRLVETIARYDELIISRQRIPDPAPVTKSSPNRLLGYEDADFPKCVSRR